jgi:hypothetical protein
MRREATRVSLALMLVKDWNDLLRLQRSSFGATIAKAET